MAPKKTARSRRGKKPAAAAAADPADENARASAPPEYVAWIDRQTLVYCQTEDTEHPPTYDESSQQQELAISTRPEERLSVTQAAANVLGEVERALGALEMEDDDNDDE